MVDDFTPHLARFQSYERARRDYRLTLPERFNLAAAICKRHQDAVTRVALHDVKLAASNTYTFGGLDYLSDKFATALAERGVTAGDVVAVILPPSARLLVAHLGALKLGSTVAPLSFSLPSEAIGFALQDSRTQAIVADYSRRSEIAAWTGNAPSVNAVFIAGDNREANQASGEAKSFWMEVHRASADFTAVETSAAAPAFIFYTADADGSLRGIVHSHAALLGQLAAFEMCNNLDINDAAAFWLAGDGAATADLLGVIYPALWHGGTVVVKETNLTTADEVFALLERYEITTAFFAPQQLDELVRTATRPRERYDLQLRTVVTCGNVVNRAHSDWVSDALGAALNIAYGKPETGMIAASCARWFAAQPESAGRIVPGRNIEIIDARGEVLPAGQTGRVAVHRTDAALYLEYFDQPEQTAARFIGDWFITGDTGRKDEDDGLWIVNSTL